MTSAYSIRRVEAEDAALLGHMVGKLMRELYPDDLDYADDAMLVATAARLVRDEQRYVAFIAFDDRGTPAGAMALNECAAVYAWGLFGEISELYVEPAHRSAGLGGLFIDRAKAFAAERSWTMLEVGAADAPRWQKSIDFYIRCGFEEIGPRLYLMIG
jgi:GNAT superfamily N-acetyltransferase